MKFRQWYLGIAVAAAALIPLSANATNVPNLLYGGAPGDYNAQGSGDSMLAHYSGVTTETAAVGQEVQGVNSGGSCGPTGSTCQETTWGMGTITQANDTVVNQTTWNSGDPNGSGGTLAFVLYGIADQSVTITGNNGVASTSYTETITNTGATASTTGAYSPYGNTTGAIQLDVYYMPTADTPCFTVGCGPNFISAADRTTNLSDGTAQVTGITNVGTLFASFTLQPGVTGDPNVTLNQSLTASNSTGKVSSGGGSANFYAECYLSSTPGPGCSQFATVTEANGFGPANDPNLLTQIFGQIGYKTLIGTTGNPLNASLLPTYCFNADGTVNTTEGNGAGSCATGPANGYKTTGNVNNAGYLISNTDPVNFIGAVPEPASLALLGSALAIFGLAIHRRRKGLSA